MTFHRIAFLPLRALAGIVSAGCLSQRRPWGIRGEDANFWLSVTADLQARGVEDIFIACIDGLSGFKDANHAVFPQTEIQRCSIHQIRHRLRCVAWKDDKAFTTDLKTAYRAVTREGAETNLLKLAEKGGKKICHRC